MKSQLEKTNEILNLARNGRRLKRFVTEKLPKIRKSLRDDSSKIDKHDDGFCSNEEPCQSLSFRLCYKSFTGSFGSSDVYSDIAGIDKKLMEKYLVRLLNDHKDEILIAMADMMVDDAKEQRDIAVDEIESMKASLIALLDHKDTD